jgi:hypothetical protein
MSAIFGISATDIFPQPGFTATQSENGGWVGKHSFAVRRTAWNSAFVRSQFVNGTSITTLDPDLSSFFAFMVVSKVEVTGEEGDFIIVGTECAGGAATQFGDEGLGTGSQPTYQLNGSLQDAPLSQHPKWIALGDTEKTNLGLLIEGGLALLDNQYFIFDEALNEQTFEDPTGDELEFAKLIAQGETTYSRPVITWTESTQGNAQLTAAQLNKLGKISTPRGSPPEPSGTRDWMLTNAYQEERGDLYSTDLEWTLSESGGHNSFLYDT